MYNVYKEIDVNYGQDTKDDIVAKVGREPDAEIDGGFGYANYNEAVQVLEFLYNSEMKIKSSAYILKTSMNTDDKVKEVTSFLKERYNYIGESSDIFMFVNALTETDATKAIALSVIGKYPNKQHMIVLYEAIPSSSNANLQSNLCHEFEQSLNAKFGNKNANSSTKLIANLRNELLKK